MEFLSLSRRRYSARNVPIGEERGEADVFAGYLPPFLWVLDSIFLSRVEGRGFHVDDNFFFYKKMCCCCLIKIARGHSNSLKAKTLLPSCEGRQVVPQKNIRELRQGHPTTVFCKISVRRSKNYLQFSITWGRLKLSRWPFHSCTVFVAYLINSLRFSKV